MNVVVLEQEVILSPHPPNAHICGPNGVLELASGYAVRLLFRLYAAPPPYPSSHSPHHTPPHPFPPSSIPPPLSHGMAVWDGWEWDGSPPAWPGRRPPPLGSQGFYWLAASLCLLSLVSLLTSTPLFFLLLLPRGSSLAKPPSSWDGPSFARPSSPRRLRRADKSLPGLLGLPLRFPPPYQQAPR